MSNCSILTSVCEVVKLGIKVNEEQEKVSADYQDSTTTYIIQGVSKTAKENVTI